MAFPVPEDDVLLDGAWIPAREASIAIADPGVQAGLGVFETLAVRQGLATEIEDHSARLRRGAGRLGIPLPSPETLTAWIVDAAARVASDHGWLKVIATRGGRVAVFGGGMDPADVGRAATAILLPWRRSPSDPLAGIKTLNYAPFVIGLEDARRRGADEGLWCNTRGHLAEGCASNLFVVSRRRIFTAAPRDGILPGVTRDHAIAVARDLGLLVHEGKLRMKRLLGADEAFLTSSLRGVRPLVVFEGRPVGRGVRGPITQEIASGVAARREIRRPPAGGTAVERG